MNVHLNQLRKIWLFEKTEQSEVMFIAHLMRASISVPDEMVIKQGDTAIRIYFIVMGKVQILINQKLVDLRAGEI
jgi:CRP-like cAMP-binding protein